MIFNVLSPSLPIDPREVWREVPTAPVDQVAISCEPNLKLCTTAYAEKCGGPITHAVLRVLDALSDTTYERLRIDVRTHRMNRGDIPCHTSSWHTDFQVSGANNAEVVHHLFLSGPPYTEFVVARNLEFGSCHDAARRLPKFYAPAGKMIRYNATEVHRSIPWTGQDGTWRYFFRATAFSTTRKIVYENVCSRGPAAHTRASTLRSA